LKTRERQKKLERNKRKLENKKVTVIKKMVSHAELITSKESQIGEMVDLKRDVNVQFAR